MSELTFEWDQHKNRANQRKHGISFEEAETVFTMTTQPIFLTPITQKKKSGFCSSVEAGNFDFYLCATVIEKRVL